MEHALHGWPNKFYVKKSANLMNEHNAKTDKVMHEYKAGTLHSGSKHGPKVKSRDQAIAIALSEQRKANRGGYK